MSWTDEIIAFNHVVPPYPIKTPPPLDEEIRVVTYAKYRMIYYTCYINTNHAFRLSFFGRILISVHVPHLGVSPSHREVLCDNEIFGSSAITNGVTGRGYEMEHVDNRSHTWNN